MKLVRLDSLFTIKNGFLASSLNLKSYFFKDSIRFFIPSNNMGTSLEGGWVSKKEVKNIFYPQNTLYIGTSGAGCHTYTYLSACEFVPSNNLSVLLPKKSMSTDEKLYYAKCITKNRFKFSYGRIPNNERLASLMIPALSEIPEWVNNTILPDYSQHKEAKINLPEEERKELWSSVKWETFRLLDYFQSFGGKLLTNQWCLSNPGSINFITSSTSNNGVNQKIDAKEAIKEGATILCNVISVSTNGQSCWAFYQDEPCVIGLDAVGLIPKVKLSKLQLLFVCKMIRKEAFRFNYGRKLNTERLEKLTIGLPKSEDGAPDWDLIEKLAASSEWTFKI